MQQVIEYIGEVLDDGHLSMPEEVRRTLASVPHTRLQVTITMVQPQAAPIEEAWAAFRQLGQDAAPGRLSDAAVNHDRYLYGKAR